MNQFLVARVSIFVLLFVAGALGAYTFASPMAPADATSDSWRARAEVSSGGAPYQFIASSTPSSNLRAKAVYVLDVTSGKVLYAKNADVPLPLASLTKVATALVVSRALRPDDTIVVPSDTAPKGSVGRLAKGDVWRVRDVINFTLVASSNEGATILAQAASTSAADLNVLASHLGLTHTHFLNVNGLDESTTQAGAYGSARDMAILFAYAASTSPNVFAATRESALSLASVNGAHTIAINTDKALNQIPGLVMGKTGYTDLAGGNLALVFDLNGRRYVAVVLGSTEQGRFDDMLAIIHRLREEIRPVQ